VKWRRGTAYCPSPVPHWKQITIISVSFLIYYSYYLLETYSHLYIWVEVKIYLSYWLLTAQQHCLIPIKPRTYYPITTRQQKKEHWENHFSFCNSLTKLSYSWRDRFRGRKCKNIESVRQSRNSSHLNLPFWVGFGTLFSSPISSDNYIKFHNGASGGL